jgi:fumarylacetoacetase
MALESWVESANDPLTHFPIQNLPFGVFSTPERSPRCGVAIGDMIVDLAVLETAGLVEPGGSAPVFASPCLNTFMSLGAAAWARVREQLAGLLLRTDEPVPLDDLALRRKVFVPIRGATLHLPFRVSGYTDFYAGRQHAINVGTMFRGAQNALPPNWLHIPIGYNGRASTVVVSGTAIRRPLGQRKSTDDELPSFGPSKRLDIELELGTVVGLPSTMGEPLTVSEADDLVFGYVLLNDWSARDIQAWEYQPLGPFQSKAFATTISPWVVTKAALEPFRTHTPPREKPLLPYLREPGPLSYDIDLEVSILPAGSTQQTRIAKTNYRHMYYSPAQQLAHHAIGGCKMDTGDLLGSGTISGPGRGEYGSLLELSLGGRDPIALADGSTRCFIEDGDVLSLTGWAQASDHRIGFGTCAGQILPAPQERAW